MTPTVAEQDILHDSRFRSVIWRDLVPLSCLEMITSRREVKRVSIAAAINPWGRKKTPA